MVRKSDFKIKKGSGFPLGVSATEKGVQFSLACGGGTCVLMLHDKQKKARPVSINMERYKTGDIFSCVLEADGIAGRLARECEYIYIVDGAQYADPYARMIRGRDRFGKRSRGIRCGFDFGGYDWTGEDRPHIPFSGMIAYRLHVRGFTKHKSSGVENAGTFAGVAEKVPYLKELGVNAVFLLPCYDFNEIIEESDDAYGQPENVPPREDARTGTAKVNYWGYAGDCAYFAPKASYAASPDCCVREFKDMVKTLHNAGIEVLCDMHFAKGTSHGMILDCLRYWAYACHVDGFKINTDVVPEELVKSDTALKSVKLISSYWKREDIDGRLADFNDGCLINIRKFILGDEGQVSYYAGNYEPSPDGCASLQYVADINGFTLMDAVSYERKHNEANDEGGLDGTDYNYSANYGIEGAAKKKGINEIRLKQVKNAITLLFASLRTPMILAGDEFGNSQKGNNNAYCQDNPVSWLDWGLVEKNKELFEYVKKMIRVRKKHIIVDDMEGNGKPGEALTANDKPDVSFHGVLPWITDYAPYSRTLGIMLSRGGLYIAINMNRCDETFQLPVLSSGTEWEAMLWTAEKPDTECERGTQKCALCAGSIAIYAAVPKK